MQTEQTKQSERLGFSVHPIVRILVIGFAGILLSSCGTLNLLRSDVRSINHDSRIIGRVDGSRSDLVKVLVVKKNPDNGELVIADSTSPNGMGDFAFLMPGDKSYFLAAIQESDRRSNGKFSPVISYYGEDSLTEIPPGKTSDSDLFVLNFSKKIDGKNPIARSLRRALENWDGNKREASGSVRIACGEIASLEDGSFDPVAGQSGLWSPVTAAKKNGLGIYFLEPYDRSKIPVIFVHGIGGTPRSWKTLIGSLDRRRYQAWVYNYPSGLRLESAAKGLSDLADRLHQHYGFRKMHVVAHSMGGLVARRAVQMIGNEKHEDYVSSLTTISTPWNGVSFAAIGAIGLPVPVPCWLDLRPNSPFIEKILSDRLACPHLLISTEKSSFRLTLPRRNDGSVSVMSQLDDRAVIRAAARKTVMEDHSGVLDAEITRRVMGSFLKQHE